MADQLLFEVFRNSRDPSGTGNIDASFPFKNWFIYWTGWKCRAEVPFLVGQWVALPTKEGEARSFVSSVPGECRQYFKDTWDTFKITPENGQRMIDGRITIKESEKERVEGLERLKKLLESQVV